MVTSGSFSLIPSRRNSRITEAILYNSKSCRSCKKPVCSSASARKANDLLAFCWYVMWRKVNSSSLLTKRFWLFFAPLAITLSRPTSWQKSVTITSDSPCSVQFKTTASVCLDCTTTDYCSRRPESLFLILSLNSALIPTLLPGSGGESGTRPVSSPTEAVAAVG